MATLQDKIFPGPLTEEDIIKLIDQRLERLGINTKSSCYRCEYYSPETQWCFHHDDKVPDGFIKTGCENFIADIPF